MGSPRVGMFARLKSAVRPFLGDASMSLPANAVYYTAAAVVLVIVLAWVIGYRSGEARRAKDLAPFTKPEPLKIQEPGVNQPSKAQSPAITPTSLAPVEANRSAQLPSTTPSPGAGSMLLKPAEVETSSTSNPTNAGDVFLAKGWGVDPREIGLNYLYLPIVNRTEAERMVKFLATNSLDAIAVPLKVDRKGSKGNNPPPTDALYRVVFRRGLTGEEYSRGDAAKQTMQAAAIRLGQVWKRDNRGTTDFSGYSWEKLVESR